MPKSRNNKKKRSRSKPAKRVAAPPNRSWGKHLSRANAVFLWFAATGLLALATQFTFKYFTGEVEVFYQEPAGRGYEFRLTNNSSTAQVIESLKVVPDFEQEFVFKITENVYGSFTENGISIPGGNTSYMPAYEFEGMNGYIIPANSSTEFRIPPLVARDYMQPESVVVFIEYQTRSVNSVIGWLEERMKGLGIISNEKRKRFLVAENYWTPIGGDASLDAIKSACRDDDNFGKSSVCIDYNR
jgi:hypothetical protein